MYKALGISEKVVDFGEKILGDLESRFKKIDENAEYNQLKVLKAMQDNKVSEACLLGTTGYGYNDIGREKNAIAIRMSNISINESFISSLNKKTSR